MHIDWYAGTEDKDALYGNPDYAVLAEIDHRASVARLIALTTEALREEWPEAEIVVHDGAHVPGSAGASVAVNDHTDTSDTAMADAIIERVWSDMDRWVVSRVWHYEECTVEALSATDLREEAEAILARGEGPVEAARVRIEGEPEHIDVLYLPEVGRAGLAWGADADWTDCDSLEDAIRRYLGDGMAE